MIKKREKFSNIFEASRKLGKQTPETEAAALSRNLPAIPEVPKELPPLESREAFDQEFKKCEKMHKDLEQKVEKVASTMDFSITELRSMVEEPSNFTSRAWKQVQAQKKEMEENLKKLVPSKKESSEKEKNQEEPSKKEKKSKGLTGKRRWLPMK